MLAGKNRYSRNERQWSLTIEPDGRLRAHLQQGGWSTISCAEPLTAGAWHFAALVVDAEKASLFLNGKLVGEVKLTTHIAATVFWSVPYRLSKARIAPSQSKLAVF